MKRLIICLCCCLFWAWTAAAKENISTLVFLTFTDNTPYGEWRTAEIMDDLLLNRLFDIKEFCIMERSAAKDVLEVERHYQGTGEEIEIAVDSGNFNYLFNVTQKDLTIKQQGDFLPSEDTRLIGDKHNAEYILHGSIDYLGEDSRTIMLPLEKFTFSNTSPYLEAIVTVRIIKASTGKIIWKKQERGVSKESLTKFNNIGFGRAGFNNRLFYEALDKISVKICKALKNDLKSKTIEL